MTSIQSPFLKKISKSALRYTLTFTFFMGFFLLYLNADYRIGMPYTLRYYDHSFVLAFLALISFLGLIHLSAFYQETSTHPEEKMLITSTLVLTLVGALIAMLLSLSDTTLQKRTNDYIFWCVLFYALITGFFLNLNHYKRGFWVLTVVIFPPISLGLTFLYLITGHFLISDATLNLILDKLDWLINTKLNIIPLRSGSRYTEITEEFLFLLFSITTLINIALVKFGFNLYLKIESSFLQGTIKYLFIAGGALSFALYLLFNFT